MSKKPATTDALYLLHEMVAQVMTARLRETHPDREFSEDELEYDDESGEYVKPFVMPMSSAEVGNIIRFLKDNDITALPTEGHMQDVRGEFADSFAERREKKAQSLLEQSIEETEQAAWLK